MNKPEFTLHSDGAARGNPGPAGAGAVLSDSKGVEIAKLKQYLGETTNNVAEYQALLLGLTAARAQGIERLSVRLDSELIVKQLQGAYRVKAPHLKPLFQEAKTLLSQFAAVDVAHVRREHNKVADRLANEAIDEA